MVEHYDLNETQYLFFSQQVTWDEAQVLCNYYNAKLAILDTMEKATRIAESIADSNIGDRFDIYTQHPRIQIEIFLSKKYIASTKTNYTRLFEIRTRGRLVARWTASGKDMVVDVRSRWIAEEQRDTCATKYRGLSTVGQRTIATDEGLPGDRSSRTFPP